LATPRKGAPQLTAPPTAATATLPTPCETSSRLLLARTWLAIVSTDDDSSDSSEPMKAIVAMIGSRLGIAFQAAASTGNSGSVHGSAGR
jgi:hypothetical protein